MRKSLHRIENSDGSGQTVGRNDQFNQAVEHTRGEIEPVSMARIKNLKGRERTSSYGVTQFYSSKDNIRDRK